MADWHAATLEAVAVGLREGIDEDDLQHRIEQVAYLGGRFEELGIRCCKPFGGSGVFVDIHRLYPHLAPEELPEVALGERYLSRAAGFEPPRSPFLLKTIDAAGEIVAREFAFARFAIPRRVYSRNHLDYVVEVMARVQKNARNNRGYRRTYEPEVLGHFFACSRAASAKGSVKGAGASSR